MISDRELNRQLRQAEVVQTLAQPIRIAIADLPRGGEQCACAIADLFYHLRTRCVLNFLACASER
jgi:hypothetical protein